MTSLTKINSKIIRVLFSISIRIEIAEQIITINIIFLFIILILVTFKTDFKKSKPVLIFSNLTIGF